MPRPGHGSTDHAVSATGGDDFDEDLSQGDPSYDYGLSSSASTSGFYSPSGIDSKPIQEDDASQGSDDDRDRALATIQETESMDGDGLREGDDWLRTPAGPPIPVQKKATIGSSASNPHFGGLARLGSMAVGVAGKRLATPGLPTGLPSGLPGGLKHGLGALQLSGAFSAFAGEDDDQEAEEQAALEAEDKTRYWELSLSARSFRYVGADTDIDAFFAVCIRSADPENFVNKVSLLQEFTPAYVLQKKEPYVLESPCTLR